MKKADFDRTGTEANPKHTYVRVPIPSVSSKPEESFVLECWPPGHESPIHSHGNSHGVLKVLYGSVQLDIFSDLSPTITDPCASKSLQSGDVIFMEPDKNQTHQLRNANAGDQGCVVLQACRFASGVDAKTVQFSCLLEASNNEYIIGHATEIPPEDSCSLPLDVFVDQMRMEYQAKQSEGRPAPIENRRESL